MPDSMSISRGSAGIAHGTRFPAALFTFGTKCRGAKRSVRIVPQAVVVTLWGP